ncbi:hypothetical protein EI94DRAFT_1758104 [Lactarius quietus]|nr:hypothetical protein EI94DRAFT_1758104 [Lactarius quietus]
MPPYAFQATLELIAEIGQTYSIGTGISGVLYAGTEFTLERALGEGHPNPRTLEAGPLRCDVATSHGPHDLRALPRYSMKRHQVIGFSPRSPLRKSSPVCRHSQVSLLLSVVPPSDHPAFYTHGDRELRSAPPWLPFRQALTPFVRMCHIYGQRPPPVAQLRQSIADEPIC